MSIREYKQGEHKSNFIGLRVVVLVGKDYRQKYYNFKKAKTDSEKEAMFKEAKALNEQWDKERILVAPPKKPKARKKKKDIQKYNYDIYNNKGEFVISYPFIRQVADHFNVAEGTVSKALKNNSLVVNHKVIRRKKHLSLPKSIEPFKTRERVMVDGSFTTAYKLYDLSGKIIAPKLFTMPELTKLTGRDSTTIHEAVKKSYPVGAKYLISRYKNKTSKVSFFDLSPLSPFFKVYVFDKKGMLIHWYVKPSVASVDLGITDTVIYQCIRTGISTHPDYFFTNHLPLSNYKQGIKTKFKTPKKVQMIKAYENGQTLSGSLSKVCKLLKLPYARARKRLAEENGRSIVKGVLLEYVD